MSAEFIARLHDYISGLMVDVPVYEGWKVIRVNACFVAIRQRKIDPFIKIFYGEYNNLHVSATAHITIHPSTPALKPTVHYRPVPSGTVPSMVPLVFCNNKFTEDGMVDEKFLPLLDQLNKFVAKMQEVEVLSARAPRCTARTHPYGKNEHCTRRSPMKGQDMRMLITISRATEGRIVTI